MSADDPQAATAAATDYYLLDEQLSDEERAIRDRVRAFGEQEVLPVINDYWERAEFRSIWCPSWRSSMWPAPRSRGTGARACHALPPGLCHASWPAPTGA